MTRRLRDLDSLGRAIAIVQASCGGETELALLLHCTPRTVMKYRNGQTRPSYLGCLQLARICRTLDGPDSLRTVEYWQGLAS